MFDGLKFVVGVSGVTNLRNLLRVYKTHEITGLQSQVQTLGFLI
jgi:hypothetical protein